MDEGLLHTGEVDMVTGVPLNVTYARVISFNRINENKLGDSLLNLASGKRVRKPEDNIPDFFRSQRLKRDSDDYTRIKNDIAKASALMDVAKGAGEMVYDGIDRMKQLVKMYYEESTSEEDKESLKAQFSSLAKEVSHLVDNTVYDGKKLISDSTSDPLDSVAFDPDLNNIMTISFNSTQVADVAGLSIGASMEDDLAAVQGELDKAGSYLANANGFSAGLNAQYNIAEKKVNVSDNTRDMITDADDGQEMVRATTRSIQHQASYAMMAQANLINSSILKLFG